MFLYPIIYLFLFNFSHFTATDLCLITNYKHDYYSILASSDSVKINKQINIISNSQIAEKKAYLGTLLMKKASFVNPISKKLSLFIEGKKLLEAAISKEKQNAEYRFLRLVIQENCPAILQYNSKIKEDVLIIRQSFNLFTEEVKIAITDYSITSKALKINE